MNKSALIKLSIAMTIFGSIGFFSRLSGLPSLELVFVRCISATVFLTAYWLISGNYKRETWQKKEMTAILIGGVFLVLNWIFFFASFEKTAITVAISIYNLAPIIVLIIGWIFFKDRIKLLGILAVVLAFIGTVLISGISINDLSGGKSVVGPFYALAASLLYAFVIITGKYIKQASPYLVTIIQTFIGVIMLLPFVHYSFFMHLTAANWFYSIFTGIVHTGIVYLLFYGSIRSLPTPVISALTYLDPLVAILLDVLITGFVPAYLQILGILFIFIALSYTFRKQQSSE
ncbi:DMT family transporter [Sporolactobacillus laevolacticus]|uniref:DMT family transporter n=1 Tax=Sporolactobacillus laevolacticus TaxID=33018 RepID=UPI0025B5FDD0|nr:DMT family transporter [Sporolactobacillus laevolacticus]MDN3954591.1 DMT family transporter [Sporolactobacillus laevolacticus]